MKEVSRRRYPTGDKHVAFSIRNCVNNQSPKSVWEMGPPVRRIDIVRTLLTLYCIFILGVISRILLLTRKNEQLGLTLIP